MWNKLFSQKQGGGHSLVLTMDLVTLLSVFQAFPTFAGMMTPWNKYSSSSYWQNWSLGRWSYMFKVTQLRRDAAGIQMQICKAYTIYTFPCFHSKNVKHQNCHHKEEEIWVSSTKYIEKLFTCHTHITKYTCLDQNFSKLSNSK